MKRCRHTATAHRCDVCQTMTADGVWVELEGRLVDDDIEFSMPFFCSLEHASAWVAAPSIHAPQDPEVTTWRDRLESSVFAAVLLSILATFVVGAAVIVGWLGDLAF